MNRPRSGPHGATTSQATGASEAFLVTQGGEGGGGPRRPAGPRLEEGERRRASRRWRRRSSRRTLRGSGTRETGHHQGRPRPRPRRDQTTAARQLGEPAHGDGGEQDVHLPRRPELRLREEPLEQVQPEVVMGGGYSSGRGSTNGPRCSSATGEGFGVARRDPAGPRSRGCRPRRRGAAVDARRSAWCPGRSPSSAFPASQAVKRWPEPRGPGRRAAEPPFARSRRARRGRASQARPPSIAGGPACPRPPSSGSPPARASARAVEPAVGAMSRTRSAREHDDEGAEGQERGEGEACGRRPP